MKKAAQYSSVGKGFEKQRTIPRKNKTSIVHIIIVFTLMKAMEGAEK